MPALDINTGKVLMESPSQIALAPDGHGGSLKALSVSGAIADMRGRGIDFISYTQIDNPIVRVIDPVFLGLHAHAPDSSGENEQQDGREGPRGARRSGSCAASVIARA